MYLDPRKKKEKIKREKKGKEKTRKRTGKKKRERKIKRIAVSLCFIYLVVFCQFGRKI